MSVKYGNNFAVDKKILRQLQGYANSNSVHLEADTIYNTHYTIIALLYTVYAPPKEQSY